MAVNCAVECVNGCILGEQCPHRQYIAEAAKFMENTSLDKILEIADEAVRKKMTAPPQWILPEDEQLN
jgi:anti-sigma factor ChrR (cupin superfamily)